MKKLVVWGAVAAVSFAAVAEIPVSVTKGESCAVPSFAGMPFVQEGAVRGSATNNTVRNTTVGTLTQKVVK